MRNWVLGWVCAAGLLGCSRDARGPVSPETPRESPWVWQEPELSHAGLTIAVGHRRRTPESDEWEPAVMIRREGKPFADAMVFHAIVSADGEKTLSDEVATVFESSPDSPVYAQAKHRLPKDPGPASVRFRVVLPDATEEWTHVTRLAP